MKRGAIYLRVSTTDQRVENQRPEIEQLALARGYEIVACYDERASAAKARPEFKRMLEDAHRGRFEVLVIWAIDRFGRSMAGNVRDVLELDRRGVQVVSVREPWLDTSGPVRAFVLTLANIPPEHRRREDDLWPAFQEAAPRMFGDLCAAVSCAMAGLEQVSRRQVPLPRLADVAAWVMAAEPSLGLEADDFLRSSCARSVAPVRQRTNICVELRGGNAGKGAFCALPMAVWEAYVLEVFGCGSTSEERSGGARSTTRMAAESESRPAAATRKRPRLSLVSESGSQPIRITKPRTRPRSAAPSKPSSGSEKKKPGPAGRATTPHSSTE